MEYKSNNGTSRPMLSTISSERRFQTRCRTSRASASPPWENVCPCHDVKRVAIIGNSEAIPLLCTWQTTLLVTRVALQPRCMRPPHLTPRHLAQQESNSIRSCWLANLWDCSVPKVNTRLLAEAPGARCSPGYGRESIVGHREFVSLDEDPRYVGLSREVRFSIEAQ